MMHEQWYKFARQDGWDWHTGTTINYREALGQTITCAAGVHVHRNPNDCVQRAQFPSAAFRVEPTDGLVPIDATKSKCRTLRVIEEIGDLNALLGWEYRELCAWLTTIPHLPWWRPDGHPHDTWQLFVGLTWTAARDAAWAVARCHHRDTARDAAWDAAAIAARRQYRATAWAAAGATARATAWAAFRAVWAVAWADEDAVGAAAGDASLRGMLFVCAGTALPQDHRQHIQARWEVWQKGYAVLCDVQGVLYVYGIAP